MSTASLFDAKPFDEARATRRRNLIIFIIAAVIVLAVVAWSLRYWPYEHKAGQFFAALQAKDYEKAYGLWMSDPNWKQHPQEHAKYPYGEFYIDWGPGGDFGLVNNYKVDTALTPKGSSTGVIVVVTVNQRAEQACLYVDKRDKTISYPPVKAVTCR